MSSPRQWVLGPPPYFDTQEGPPIVNWFTKQNTTLMAPSTNTKGYAKKDCIDYVEKIIVEHTTWCHGEVVAPPPNGHQDQIQVWGSPTCALFA